MKKRMELLLLLALCQVANMVAATWMLGAIIVGSPRAWRLAVAYDQLANAATGGSEDETISSRANRVRKEGRRWGCILCAFLNRIDKNHCGKSSGV